MRARLCADEQPQDGAALVDAKKVLLRLLMTICSLGAEWKDPTKIPVKEIIEEWRAQSTRGRYESRVWSAPALAELVGAADSGDGSGGGGRAPCPRSLASISTLCLRESAELHDCARGPPV